MKFSDLQNVIITSVVEDNEGFIWIGSNKGLFSFDGRELTKYSQDSSPFSIANNTVANVFTDDKGNIYACHSSGYSKFERKSGKFINVSGKLQHQNILAKLSKGDFIAFTGINQLSIVNDSLNLIKKSVTIEKVESSIKNTGNLYKSSPDLFCLWDQNSLLVVNNNLDILIEKDLPAKINSLVYHDDRIILGTQTGIITLSMTGEIVSSNPVIEKFCKEKPINLIITDSEQNVVFGITGLGIYKYNHETDKIQFVYEFQEEDGNSADFNLRFLDKYNRLWIRRGVNSYLGLLIIETDDLYPEFSDLTNYLYLSGLKAPIFSVELDKDNRPVIITENELYIFNPITKEVYPTILEGIQGIYISTLIDRQNRLWILTTDKLYVCSINNSHITIERELKIGPSVVAFLYELNDGIVLVIRNSEIISIDTNIEHIDYYSETEVPYRLNNYPFPSPDKKQISFKSKNQPLIHFSPSAGFFEGEDFEYDTDIINTMIDRDGNIWYSAMDGLYVEWTDGKRSKFDMNNGLPDNFILETIEDRIGNIWIITTNGLAKYESSQGNIINYRDLNGTLYYLKFGSVQKTTDNELYIYGRKSLMKINADAEPLVSTPPQPHVSYVMTNNKDYYGSPNELILKHNQRHLTFNFTSLEFIRSEMIQYEYKMRGHDDSWTEIGNYNNAIYSNLPSGKYTFLVRAKYDGSAVYSEAFSLPVKIKYSFWNHPIFITGFGLFILVITALIIRSFTRIKISRTRYRLKSENEELKLNLFSNLSHTFRTPVSLVIAPFQELVSKREWDKNETTLIETIDKNLERIIHLTDQFLDYDNEMDVLQSTDYSLQVEVKDIVPLIRDVAQVFRPVSIKNGISISISVPETFILPFDEDKVVKIFYNLIGNAIKFTPAGGSIKIRAKKNENMLLLSVIDTGVGIGEEVKSKIFDRYFFKKSNSISHNSNSSHGIGLAHTKHLVSVHKGEITISDNKPKGTVFTFSLPISINSYTTEEIVEEEELDTLKLLKNKNEEVVDHYSESKLNILLVEDNEELLRYLKSMLVNDYNVFTSKDGIEAIDTIGNNMLDIIMTDIMMPRMDGFELCKWIKESPEHCHLPVIMLTAKAAKDDQLKGIGAGADAYLTKPFDPEYLKAIIQNILDNRNKIQAIVQKGDKVSTNLNTSDHPVIINELDTLFLDKLNDLLDNNLSNPDLKINHLCREIGFSRTIFFKKVNALTGMTPNDFISNYRLNKAIELIKKGENSMSLVSEKTGFSSPSVFSRKFKAKFEVSPSEYLKKASIPS